MQQKRIVIRADLYDAVKNENWDLLDMLLEIDASKINDNAMFTDTWGEWWGMLYQCVISGQIDGVKILLKYGADRQLGSWGDTIPTSPIEAAKGNIVICELLTNPEKPSFIRKTNPAWPTISHQGDLINKQGDLRDQTGLMFMTPPPNDEA